MGRERQKRKNRSSITKSKPKINNRTKAGRRKVNFLGNETIAKNWDRKLTLSQNYKRLGLSSKLGSVSGGIEKKATRKEQDLSENVDSLAIPVARKTGKLIPDEVQVERDPATGRILRIVRRDEDQETVANPLNDPLNDLTNVDETTGKSKPTSGIVAQLEAQAEEEAELEARKKRPRQQSQREEEWLTSLFEKHGDNIKAMVRDRTLNPMQQTEGDISRRLRKWKARNEQVG